MKRLLLDTHAFLWWISEHYQMLGEKVIAAVENSDNQIYVSAATPWEISIKKNLGKLKAPDDISSIIDDEGFEEMAITGFHGEQAGDLPNYHKDPFDRVIIAQAQAEGLVIVTNDAQFAKYGIKIMPTGIKRDAR